jgi:hypothetical protein
MKNKRRALNLLEDLIEESSKTDELHKKKSMQEGKAVRAVGESWLLFHLRVLRDLINEEESHGQEKTKN